MNAVSIRLRLAFWCVGVLAAVLVLSGFLLYFIMASYLFAETDDSVAEWAHHVASTIQLPTGASPSFHNMLLPPIDAFSAPGVYVQVSSPYGEPIARTSNLGDRNLPIAPSDLAGGALGRTTFTTVRLGTEDLRLYTHPLVSGGHLFGFVQVGRSYADTFATLATLRLALLVAGFFALVVAGGVSWAVARRALQPVSTLTHTAQTIALSRGFSRRVPDIPNRDELGELARTFNEMLGSLEEAYAAQQRFVADASHELRTPLTAVRGNLELLRTKGDELPSTERAALIGAAGAEAERMARLVADLLTLARADAGQKLPHGPVELDRVLLDVFQQARILSRDVKLTLPEIDQLVVLGDADQLKQLLLALVDNALKYTPTRGTVSLGLRRRSGEAIIEVRDTGIGIAPADLLQSSTGSIAPTRPEVGTSEVRGSD